MRITSPEALFDRIAGDDFSGVIAFVKTQVENTTIEYKTTTSNDGKLEDLDRRLLGELLSGMANASGGVIIMGIRATGPRRDPKPVKRLLLYEDHLNETVRNMVDPQISVRTASIPSPNDPDQGLIVIGVPNAFPKPFMATKDNLFYMRRAGVTNPVRETATIRGLVMFGARPEIAIELGSERWVGQEEIYLARYEDRRSLIVYEREVRLCNVGSVPVRDHAWTVVSSLGEFKCRPGTESDSVIVVRNELDLMGADCERVLHTANANVLYPGMKMVIGKMRYAPDPNDLRSERIVMSVFLPDRTESFTLPLELVAATGSA